MELIPAGILEHELGPEENQITLLVPRFTDPVLSRLVQPRLKSDKKYIRVPLEKRGSLLWVKMNGEVTVGDLVTLLGEHFSDDQKEVPERLSGYLYAMWENKFIEFRNLD